jgi:hypothetical protein
MGQSSICKSYDHRTLRRKAKGASFHDLRHGYVFLEFNKAHGIKWKYIIYMSSELNIWY